jgi:hypothetical protein
VFELTQVQKEGVDLVLCGLREFGAQLIADEMGIGKTRQALVMATESAVAGTPEFDEDVRTFEPFKRQPSKPAFSQTFERVQQNAFENSQILNVIVQPVLLVATGQAQQGVREGGKAACRDHRRDRRAGERRGGARLETMCSKCEHAYEAATDDETVQQQKQR